MAAPRGLQLSIAGVKVHLPLSALFGVLLLAYLFADVFQGSVSHVGGQWLLAIIFALALTVSVLTHEFGHALMARKLGNPVSHITLWIFGGFTVYERKKVTPGTEALIAGAGPAVSLLLTLVSWVFVLLLREPTGPGQSPSPLVVLLITLTFANGFMTAYNLLPALPLDGGALLKSFVWAVTKSETKGSLVAGYAGYAAALFTFALPWLFAWRVGGQPQPTTILIGVFIGGFLWMGARNGLQRAKMKERISGFTLADITKPAAFVSRGTPLNLALAQQEEQHGWGLVLLDEQSHVVGVGVAAAIKAVPTERTPWMQVEDISQQVQPLQLIAENTPTSAVLQQAQQLQEHGAATRMLLVVRPAAIQTFTSHQKLAHHDVLGMTSLDLLSKALHARHPGA